MSNRIGVRRCWPDTPFRSELEVFEFSEEVEVLSAEPTQYVAVLRCIYDGKPLTAISAVREEEDGSCRFEGLGRVDDIASSREIIHLLLKAEEVWE